MPTLTVIAGANGCGKSTLTKWARAYFQQSSILDPDAVAVELAAETSVEPSPIEAGKRVLISAEEFLVKGVSFSVETTLSGGTYLKMMRRARELGFGTRVFYIGTDSLSINIHRVEARVLKGGHDVPFEDQQRRYPRSFSNLPRAVGLADEAVLLDNSRDEGHRVVGLKLNDTGMLYFDPVPSWLEPLRSSI